MAPILSLPVLEDVIRILSDNGIQGTEKQSGYMHELAGKYNKNHNLTAAADTTISKLFEDIGLGAGKHGDSRNHHMIYAYVSGICLFMGWGQGQQPTGRRCGTVCLYCCQHIKYKMEHHLTERHSATIIPTLIQTLIAFWDMSTQEQNIAGNLSLPFSPAMNGQLPSLQDWPLFVTSASRGDSYEQHGETTTLLDHAGTEFHDGELEAPVNPMWQDLRFDYGPGGPNWLPSFDQGE